MFDIHVNIKLHKALKLHDIVDWKSKYIIHIFKDRSSFLYLSMLNIYQFNLNYIYILYMSYKNWTCLVIWGGGRRLHSKKSWENGQAHPGRVKLKTDRKIDVRATTSYLYINIRFNTCTKWLIPMGHMRGFPYYAHN